MKKSLLLFLASLLLLLCSCGYPKPISDEHALGRLASPTPHTHRWKGSIHSGDITCSDCNEKILTKTIKEKQGKDLSSVEKALIYWNLDYYLTATDSNGKYSYSEKEAFSKVEELFGVTETYLKDNIWNGHARDDYNKYYG